MIYKRLVSLNIILTDVFGFEENIFFVILFD